MPTGTCLAGVPAPAPARLDWLRSDVDLTRHPVGARNRTWRRGHGAQGAQVLDGPCGPWLELQMVERRRGPRASGRALGALAEPDGWWPCGDMRLSSGHSSWDMWQRQCA